MQQASLPKENIYGHTKKLRYIIGQIDRYLETRKDAVNLLDFGCGNGSAVSQFLIRPDVEYYGVDIHEPSLQYAQEHYGNAKARFLNTLPEGIRFDIIVYADILEHLDDPVAFLKPHRALLKDGGIIIGSVPNGYGPFENEKRLDRWLHLTQASQGIIGLKRKLFGSHSPDAAGGKIPYNMESGHLQFFTRGMLLHTLKQAGFQDIRLGKGAFVGAPLSEMFLLRGEKIARLNSRLADFLPYWTLSTWYFTATK